jgi:hypothetical protein
VARSIAATGAFMAAGLASWLLLVRDWRSAIIQSIFYIILIVNTYFSIRCFSRIAPRTLGQLCVDSILAALYLMLAACICDGAAFMFIASCIFAVAVLKYEFMLKALSNSETVKRKILVDALGAVLCVTGWGAIQLGYGQSASAAVTFVFAVANLYLLILRPMYPSY